MVGIHFENVVLMLVSFLQAVLASREGYNVATFVYQKDETKSCTELICEGFTPELSEMVNQFYQKLSTFYSSRRKRVLREILAIIYEQTLC